MTDPSTSNHGTTPDPVLATISQPSLFQLSRLEARFARGFPSTHSPKEFAEYIYIKVQEYIYDDFTKTLLAEAFTEDFLQFTLERWQIVATVARRLIRNLLLQLGVYVRSGRGLPIAECLIELISKGYEQWTEGEEKPKNNLKLGANGNL